MLLILGGMQFRELGCEFGGKLEIWVEERGEMGTEGLKYSGSGIGS